MASSTVIGILKALLTADTAQFVSAMGKAQQTTKSTSEEIAKLTPQAERMAKAFSGDKVLYSAKNLAAAVEKIGGVTKLTGAEQAKVNRTLGEALLKYKALGIDAPDSIRRLHKETTKQTTLVQRLTDSLGPMGKALIGAFTFGAVVSAGKKLLDFADTLTNLSARTGISTTALQKFQLAFEPAGVSIDTVAKAATELSVRLVKGDKSTVAALGKLGLSADALKKMSLEQMLFKVGDAVGKMGNQAEKIYASKTLFGKSGVELLQGLNGHLEETTKKFEDMGLIIDEQTVKAADDFGDQLGLIGKQLLSILANALGPMLPALSALANGFSYVAKVVGTVFGLALKGVAEAILVTWEAFAKLLAGVADLAQRIPFVGKQLGFLAGTSDWLKKSANDAGTMLNRLAFSTKETGSTVKAATAPMLGLGDAVEKTSKSTEDWLKQFPSLDAAMAFVRKSVDGLTEAQKKELDTGLALGLSVDQIAKKMGLAAPVVQLYGEALKSSEAFAKQLAETNRKVAESLQEHFLEQASKNLALYMDQIRAIQAAGVDTQHALQGMDFRRAEAAIEAAKQSGAAWQQVYAMERELSRRKTDAAIADMTREFEARTLLLRARIQSGEGTVLDQQQLDAETKAYQAAVAAMEEDFVLSEDEKLAALQRTHNAWIQTYEHMKEVGEDTLASVSDGFAQMIVGAKSFKDAMLDVWHSIQSGIASILSSILNDYLKRFIGGMIRGSSSAGGQIASNLAGGVPLGGGGGLLGSAGSLAMSTLGKSALGLLGIGGGTGAAAGVAGVESSIFGGAAAAGGGAAAGGAAGTAAGAGGAAAGGGGFMSGAGAFLTNPWTAVVAGGVIGGILLYRHFTKGSRANDARDKDLAQFAGFDPPGKRDDKNPPGFYGLDAWLTKYKHHELFDPFVKANSPDKVKKAFQPIQALAAAQGRQLKSYHTGGVIDAPDGEEIKINALGGESVLTRAATTQLGGAVGVRAINAGATAAGAGLFGLFGGRGGGRSVIDVIRAKLAAGRAVGAPDDLQATAASLATARGSVGGPVGALKGLFGFGARGSAKQFSDVFLAQIAAHQNALTPFSRGIEQGFVPPGASMPNALRGGTFGEDITPQRTEASGSHRTVNMNVTIHAMDSQSMTRVFNTELLPRMKQAIQLNTANVTVAHRRALGLV